MAAVKIVLAVFIPPLATYLQVGFTKYLLLNIVLTFLGYLPGVLHALWLVIKR